MADKKPLPTERFSREEAQQKGETIRAYWAKRGYKVNVFVEPITGSDKTAGSKAALTGWRVTTDMVGGLPKELHASKLNAAKGG